MKTNNAPLHLRLDIIRGTAVGGGEGVRYGFRIMFGNDVVGDSGPRYADAQAASEQGTRAFKQIAGDVTALSQAERVVRVRQDIPEDF